MSAYLVSVSKNYYPSKEENVVKSIFSQYESVIIYSLITSFGLDFLIKDQHGGDVDTIHNVRQIGKDPEMTYKNKQNQEDYENRGKYDSRSYHSNSNYIQKRNEIRQKKKDNTLTDAYTGEKLDSSSKVYKGVAEGEYVVGLIWEDPVADYVRQGVNVRVVFQQCAHMIINILNLDKSSGSCPLCIIS